MLKPGTLTTRTLSPYFSPNSAIAPAATACSGDTSTSVVHRRVPVHLLVDDALDAIEIVARDRLEVHEVEAQAIGRDERAGLLDVRAEHLAQRGVEQVRRRVITPCGVADIDVDLGRHDVARAKLAAHDADMMRARKVLANGMRAHAVYDRLARRTVDAAGVGNLPARLEVERRFRQDDQPV